MGKQQTKYIPSGKRLHNYGKSPCLMGKSTISLCSIAILTSPEGTSVHQQISVLVSRRGLTNNTNRGWNDAQRQSWEMQKPDTHWIPCGYVNSLLLKMAIEIVGLPINQ